jgi:hypothetical protein
MMDTHNERDFTRDAARLVLVSAILAIAVGYAAAFMKGGAPAWAPWLLAVGIPAALCAIMVLGATRGRQGIGSLKLPFLFVFVVLASGFCLALGLPALEGSRDHLMLGLPLRAAILIYGIGLFPTVILPVAYALTFSTQTLSEADVARVREMAERTRAIAVQAKEAH